MTSIPGFFGRESQLDRLGHMLGSVLAGNGKTIFIAGDAGSGKSALVEAFIERAQAQSTSVMATMTTCDSQTGHSDAYLPFIETLAQLTGESARFNSQRAGETNSSRLKSFASVTAKAILEEAPNLIGSFIPGGSFMFYAARFSAEKAGWMDKLHRARERAKIDSKIEPEQIFRMYTDLLRRLSREVPLILVFDDLQWVDASSTQLFFHLSRRIGESPILLIGTYRPNDLSLGQSGQRHPMVSVINEIKRIEGDVVIDLGEESDDDRRMFVASLIDAEPNDLGADFREAFFRHTQGHPLFAQELFRSFRERDVLVQGRDGRWIQSGEVNWKELPPRVEGVIEERVSRLEEQQRDALSLASVQGERFIAQVIARLRDEQDRKLLHLLSRDLERRHNLVREEDTIKVGGQRVTRYHFSHGLFQQYLYNDLGEGERKHLHSETGEIIEEIYADDWYDMTVELAHHFEQADDWQKAIPYCMAAANRSLTFSSYDTALEFLENAIARTDELPPPEAQKTRLQILLTLGSIHQALKGFTHPDVEQTFTEARQLAQDSDDPILLASAIYGLWTLNLFKLNLQKAHELALEIESLGEARDNPIVKVIAYRALANGYYQAGKLRETARYANWVIEHYDPEKVGDYLGLLTYDPKIFALGLRAWAESLLGEFDAAKATVAEMFAWASELDHPVSTCVAYLSGLKLEYNLRDHEAIQQHAADICALAREYGFPWYLAFGSLFANWCAGMASPDTTGGAAQAEALQSLYVNGVAPDGNRLIHAQFCRMITELLLENKDLDGALAWVDRGIEVATSHNDVTYLAELLRIRGTIMQGKGDGDAAIVALEQGIAVAEAAGHRLFELRARASLCEVLELNNKPGDEARDALQKLAASFPEGPGYADLDVARGVREGA